MYGPIITGIFGKTLHMIDRKILQLPHIGGVILFRQNFSSKEQIRTLITQVQEVRIKHQLSPVLVLIDHEGGVVQRLVGEHFTQLPSALNIGQLYQKKPLKALQIIRDCGLITAYELHSVGINVCLGPVLDLFNDKTKEESSRFYAYEPEVIVSLSTEFNHVLQKHGILSVSKHFPGLGLSKANTHYNVSISKAKLSELLKRDLQPYILLHRKNLLPAIMTAHRVFPDVDTLPICISTKWIQDLLRQHLTYEGLIFTDCVQMIGASIMGGSLHDKIHNSLAAGCDFVISSQTPFDSYTQLYNMLRSPIIDELLIKNPKRDERIKLILKPLLQKCGDFTTSYDLAKENIEKLQSGYSKTEQYSVTRRNHLPTFYKFKKKLLTHKMLKKYLKSSTIIHWLTFSHFKLHLLIYKLKNFFRK